MSVAPRSASKFITQSFVPPVFLRNPHVQSVVGEWFRTSEGITFRRRRLELPDGDFIDLDFANVDGITWEQAEDSAPVVLVLHGHMGSARRGYACEAYRQLAQAGIRSVGMNFRSCSGEINRLPQMYHAGLTEDVAFVVNWLRHRYPVRLGMVGFSLGASMLLKFLGEATRDVTASVAISPPFDLSASSKALSRSLYNRYVTPNLRERARQKAHQLDGAIDMEQVMAAKSIYEFDAVCTAPLHGFKDVEDYYTKCSASQFLPTVDTPTFIIRSLDDPFLDRNDIPYRLIDEKPLLQAIFTEYGGHVAFADWQPWRFVWWAQRQATLFLKDHLF